MRTDAICMIYGCVSRFLQSIAKHDVCILETGFSPMLTSICPSVFLDIDRGVYRCSILLCVADRDIASLARAAVSGDESALDMFNWKKGKTNMRMTGSGMGLSEAVTFYIGGMNGQFTFYIGGTNGRFGRFVQFFFEVLAVCKCFSSV